MKVNLSIVFLGCFFILLQSCKSSMPAVATKKENINTVADFGDRGQLILPGDWQLSSENKLTNQKFFRNKDSVLIAVTINPMNKFGFYSIGMVDTVFTRSFYEWESKHYKKQGYEVKILEQQYNGQYIIFSAKNAETNATLLYGGKKDKGYSLIVLDPRKLSINQQKSFLIQLYREN
jgi:hypothetical protein